MVVKHVVSSEETCSEFIGPTPISCLHLEASQRRVSEIGRWFLMFINSGNFFYFWHWLHEIVFFPVIIRINITQKTEAVWDRFFFGQPAWRVYSHTSGWCDCTTFVNVVFMLNLTQFVLQLRNLFWIMSAGCFSPQLLDKEIKMKKKKWLMQCLPSFMCWDRFCRHLNKRFSTFMFFNLQITLKVSMTCA